MLVKENLSGRKGPNNVVLNPKDGYLYFTIICKYRQFFSDFKAAKKPQKKPLGQEPEGCWRRKISLHFYVTCLLELR